MNNILGILKVISLRLIYIVCYINKLQKQLKNFKYSTLIIAKLIKPLHKTSPLATQLAACYASAPK